jgi:hypothetical protein
METEQEYYKKEKIKPRDILFYKLSYKSKWPARYFKCIGINEDFGTIEYNSNNRKDTLGIAYVRKANFFEKIIYHLFY